MKRIQKLFTGLVLASTLIFANCTNQLNYITPEKTESLSRTAAAGISGWSI